MLENKALAAAESAMTKQKAEPRGTALQRNLNERMKQAGLGIRALARKAVPPVDHSVVSRLANGQSKQISLDVVTRLAGTLGCTVSELLDEVATAAEPVEGVGVVVALHQIEPSSFNARKLFAEGPLAELVESIAEHGLLQDLIVRARGGGHYEIVAGERRWRALQRLAKDGRWKAQRPVPCRVVSGDDGAMRAVALVENLQREDLAPLEEAEAYAALCKLDPKIWTTATIAEKIGKTRRHVQLRLELLAKLAAPLKMALAENKITLAQARAASIATPKRQKELLPDMVEDGQLATAEDVRFAATEDWIPLERAFFDLEGLEDSIAEDPETGKRYFTNSDLFLTRQKQAAEAKVAELKTEWAWAELRDYYSEWEFKHSTDKAKAGAIVTLHSYSFKVAIHTGLVKPAPAKSGHKADAPRPEHTRGLLIHAHNVKTAALQAAIAGDHRTTLILVILGLMGATRCVHIRGDVHGGDDLILAPAVEAILDRPRPQFKNLLAPKAEGHVTAGLQIANARYGIGTEDKDEVALYQALKGMGDHDLNELFAALVAARAGTFNEWGPELGDRRLAVALADDLKINVADHWQIDEAYLKLCRKARLAEIAAAIKVGLQKRRTSQGLGPLFLTAAELEKLPGPKLRDAILARLDELRAAEAPPYIPREMRFGSKAALEAHKPKPRSGQPAAGDAGGDDDLAASLPPRMRAKKPDG